MRLNITSLSLAAVLLVASSSAAAITQPEEWAARIKTAQSVGALGTDLFGDSTNFYNGQTSFSVTDIDLPGNDKLPMRLTRTIEAAPLTGVENSGLLGSWELDAPYISVSGNALAFFPTLGFCANRIAAGYRRSAVSTIAG